MFNKNLVLVSLRHFEIWEFHWRWGSDSKGHILINCIEIVFRLLWVWFLQTLLRVSYERLSWQNLSLLIGGRCWNEIRLKIFWSVKNPTKASKWHLNKHLDELRKKITTWQQIKVAKRKLKQIISDKILYSLIVKELVNC